MRSLHSVVPVLDVTHAVFLRRERLNSYTRMFYTHYSGPMKVSTYQRDTFGMWVMVSFVDKICLNKSRLAIHNIKEAIAAASSPS